MEEMMNPKFKNSYDMKPPPPPPPPPIRPATLTLREESQYSISKPKPKIRIIHIFAPKIIKTDPANFRDLVQKLTGKPAKGIGNKKIKKKKKVSQLVCKGKFMEGEVNNNNNNNMWELEDNYGNSGGYLCELEDVDGYFQGFGDFSMLPLMSSSATSSSTTSTSSHMDHMIGEAQVII